jgi:hypothetical protein
MLSDINSAVLFTILGVFLGIILFLALSLLLPKIIQKLTPRIDEEKELIRGNTAVAEYYGRITAAVITGISIIIAAAIIAGIHG